MGPKEPPVNHARDALARAREAAPEAQVLKVRLSPGNRTHRIALVDIKVGPVVVTYGYQRLRKYGRWQVHLPLDPDGNAAVHLPKKLDEKIVQMVRDAAEGDAAVSQGITGRWTW